MNIKKIKKIKKTDVKHNRLRCYARLPITIKIIISISIKRIVSVCLNEFAQSSRYRTENLQVGRGRPETSRGGDKNCEGAPGWGWAVVEARATPDNPDILF